MRKQSVSSDSSLLSKQILSLWKIYIPVLLIIFLAWLTGEVTPISVYELVADPNEIGQIPPYSGIVSNIGLLLFCFAVSICIFSSYLIDVRNSKDRKWKLFLQCSGYFVLLLLIDDAFQIHENLSTLLFGVEANISVVDKKLQNGLETVVFGFYGALFCLYGFYFRKLIYRTETLVLILAFCFFGMSIVIDVLPESLKGHFILEEGFKLLGIASLMTYYVKVCYQAIKKSL